MTQAVMKASSGYAIDWVMLVFSSVQLCIPTTWYLSTDVSTTRVGHFADKYV